ncbi:MAG: hypothetical protein FJW21_07725 [Acidimicrobiia bacterium]|nr:hypothetical protein [Acidimicrobiia bacterium]
MSMAKAPGLRTAFGVALQLTVLASGLLLAAPQDVPLETLQARLADYIEAYERDLAAVVSEEHYVQESTGQSTLWPGMRTLKSEFLLTRVSTPAEGDSGWVAFRDVFEVDGTPVQDRSGRLIQLFLTPTGDSLTQVHRIVEESAKHNLGWVRRTVNVPTMVLQFGKRSEQARSQFRRGAKAKVGEHEVRELRFTERATPRVIQTIDNAAAQGTFWIDETTGRVHRTEMRISTGSTSVVIGVSYALQSALEMWLPVLMSERYSTPRQPIITGRAIYQNFRRFNVTVDTIVKK